jgi:hypothetical protein
VTGNGSVIEIRTKVDYSTSARSYCSLGENRDYFMANKSSDINLTVYFNYYDNYIDRLRAGRFEIRILTQTRNFLFSKTPGPGLGPTHIATPIVLDFHSEEGKVDC